ncbi:sulfotransferase domain-containing protein [Cycloclasticus pugetii]|jgi:hypothetical protein|uniref:sulfotransferase domain-containing protein n=1 Tax=Cycloclasticus pugetii TaxID=34068 RepID=UPI0009237464|nr:sulfotransferase domain-containing protein [Cycloclasticus pugetii]SHJ54258.1 Sulfotransferase domain-containing protein [Cycloclasticus pugetii]
MPDLKYKNIVVSGMMRSGTTFLQQILNAHEGLCVSNQSQTKIFLDEKAKFHKYIGIEHYHLLSHYNEGGHYSLNAFVTWLQFKTNQGFFNKLDAKLSSSSSCIYNGVKEVMVEEYMPYLITNNVRCLIIVRDPRDVISSMSFGLQGAEFTGKRRPVLFDLRNWRKSVQIAKSLRSRKNFMLVKFEDLLDKKYELINSIFNFLDVAPLKSTETIEVFEKTLQQWKGNSSFCRRKLFDKEAIGVYKSTLPAKVVKYIEATCLEEMEYVGYQCEDAGANERVKTIKQYIDPFEVNRLEFIQNYSSLNDNVFYEMNRVCLKRNNPLIMTNLMPPL